MHQQQPISLSFSSIIADSIDVQRRTSNACRSSWRPHKNDCSLASLTSITTWSQITAIGKATLKFTTLFRGVFFISKHEMLHISFRKTSSFSRRSAQLLELCKKSTRSPRVQVSRQKTFRWCSYFMDLFVVQVLQSACCVCACVE